MNDKTGEPQGSQSSWNFWNSWHFKTVLKLSWNYRLSSNFRHLVRMSWYYPLLCPSMLFASSLSLLKQFSTALFYKSWLYEFQFCYCRWVSCTVFSSAWLIHANWMYGFSVFWTLWNRQNVLKFAKKNLFLKFFFPAETLGTLCLSVHDYLLKFMSVISYKLLVVISPIYALGAVGSKKMNWVDFEVKRSKVKVAARWSVVK